MQSSVEVKEDKNKIRKQKALTLVDAIINAGVKLIAWDFDRTANCNHSGGAVAGKDLVELNEALNNLPLSEDFLLTSTLLDEKGINQAIVSFASDRLTEVSPTMIQLGGVSMIRSVLTQARQPHLHKFYVCGMYPSAENIYRKSHLPRLNRDKTFHLKEAMNYFNIENPKQTLLIDDDDTNVEGAALKNFFGIHVAGNKGFNLDQINILVPLTPLSSPKP